MKYLIIILASLSLITEAEAGRRGSGKSKRNYVGVGSSGISDTPEREIKHVELPTIQTATIIKKAGIRTCANQHCTVIAHYPKGKKIQWAVKKDGFINVHDTPYWIMATDVK